MSVYRQHNASMPMSRVCLFTMKSEPKHKFSIATANTVDVSFVEWPQSMLCSTKHSSKHTHTIKMQNKRPIYSIYCITLDVLWACLHVHSTFKILCQCRMHTYTYIFIQQAMLCHPHYQIVCIHFCWTIVGPFDVSWSSCRCSLLSFCISFSLYEIFMYWNMTYVQQCTLVSRLLCSSILTAILDRISYIV